MKLEYLKSLPPLEERMKEGNCPLISELMRAQTGLSLANDGDTKRISDHILTGCPQCNSVMDQLVDGSVRADFSDYGDE
jgi:hypothetical protein